MKHFVTAAVFTYPHEIAILRHLLQDAGLQFYFENETMLTVVPMYTQALGGIKLKVHVNDLDTVKLILDEFERGNNLKIV
ncbi:hypothetical protein [Flavobacterium subsaxonicum]|uniref:DUF2007 domain-containing protein n=1 Tax=Flavobacterium subsaxonicum WB 4.1-42 = DSM 21790 TaxID=1121898 RepID=A0A0A2MJC9_9FLAO|nr:hypothetical protein [Flavobacterium subsaxonicum]KGO92717.1 hypothetical protein Q766_11410 [Flavobacterium subsaxonicum WB 4.1-42 = DSM 21790]